MSSAEFTEWMAYERVWGSILPHERIDLGFAKLEARLVSLLGKRRGRTVQLRDYLPTYMSDLLTRREQDPRQLQATLETWAHAND